MLGTILIFIKRLRTPLAVMAILAIACSQSEVEGSDITIVATTSIARDLVLQVVGDAADVEVLMPIGVDPHDYQPSARQSAAIRDTDLVVAWGLGLEEGLGDVLGAAAAEGVPVVELSAVVEPIPFAGHAHDEDHEDEGGGDADDEVGLDPHTWTDPVRMADAARHLGSVLEMIDPDGPWDEGAERAAGSLLETHEQVTRIVAEIPADRRKLITNHESLGYFADRYGFEVIGVVIAGGSTLAAPSSAEIAELVEIIREADVEVVFGESIESTALIEAVAAEVEGVRVVELLTGSLAEPGQPGDTLNGLLIENATHIAEALGAG